MNRFALASVMSLTVLAAGAQAQAVRTEKNMSYMDSPTTARG